MRISDWSSDVCSSDLLAFLNQAPDKRTVPPDRVAVPASPNVLQAGAVIAAALITGIRSDLPGQITAQVTENIYDSPTGRSEERRVGKEWVSTGSSRW